MRGWSLCLVALFVTGKKISKKIDVEGLKLYQEPSGPVSESVQYKFKLSRRDRPEIQLLVNSKWIPLKITVDGKNEAVTIYSKAPRGKWQRRGRPTQIRYLNNINGDNELVIGFNENEWNISINGKDVSRKFGQPLKHNGAWQYIRRARAVSGYPIRRFTVTKNMKIPEWESVNHELCGFNYRLPDDKTSYLREQMPEVFRQIEVGMTQLSDRCHNNRDGTKMGESRIVGGRPSLPAFYPWMVALRLGNSPKAHNCGASLINRCWAVSAAHCFADPSLANKYTARVGDYFNRNTDANANWSPLESVHETKLKRVIKHFAYDHDVYNNDIALIEFDDCVPSFNQFRAPICLPTATEQHGEGECCHIHGWGQLASNQEQLNKFISQDEAQAQANPGYQRLYPDGIETELHPAELQFSINFLNRPRTCSDQFPRTFNPATQICSSYVLEGSNITVDSCQGDSGGPLACEAPVHVENRVNDIGEIRTDARFTLWGITSYGGDREYQCSTGSKSGVYTKVTNYMDWIKNVFKNNRVNPNA